MLVRSLWECAYHGVSGTTHVTESVKPHISRSQWNRTYHGVSGTTHITESSQSMQANAKNKDMTQEEMWRQVTEQREYIGPVAHAAYK